MRSWVVEWRTNHIKKKSGKVCHGGLGLWLSCQSLSCTKPQEICVELELVRYLWCVFLQAWYKRNATQMLWQRIKKRALVTWQTVKEYCKVRGRESQSKRESFWVSYGISLRAVTVYRRGKNCEMLETRWEWQILGKSAWGLTAVFRSC